MTVVRWLRGRRRGPWPTSTVSVTGNGRLKYFTDCDAGWNKQCTQVQSGLVRDLHQQVGAPHQVLRAGKSKPGCQLTHPFAQGAEYVHQTGNCFLAIAWHKVAQTGSFRFFLSCRYVW